MFGNLSLKKSWGDQFRLCYFFLLLVFMKFYPTVKRYSVGYIIFIGQSRLFFFIDTIRYTFIVSMGKFALDSKCCIHLTFLPSVVILDLRCWYFLCWLRVLLRGVSGKSPIRQIPSEASKHLAGHVQPRPTANRPTWWEDYILSFVFWDVMYIRTDLIWMFRSGKTLIWLRICMIYLSTY